MTNLIPPDALQQHVAILGKTGSGKTATAKSAIVEPLLHYGAQVCVIDPTSAWWGLRLKSDGETATNERVVIVGGERGDVPLAPSSGEAVARLVAEQGASVVVDTGGLTVGEATRWMIAFAGTLYTTIKGPLHLIIDEAHNYAPQARANDVDGGKMLHAVNRLMSGGRSRGIRGVLITQRPAKLHKDSLTCCDTLLAHRVIAPQDRAAIKEWVDGCGDGATGKRVMDSLASLARGECWVWYPEGGHLERVKMPMPRTFDSSKAPTGSEKRITLGSIDLSAVRASMDQAIKEAEANDPKRLRARIAELERAVSAKGKDAEIMDSGRVAQLEAERAGHRRTIEGLSTRLNGLIQWAQALRLCITNASTALNTGYPVAPDLSPAASLMPPDMGHLPAPVAKPAVHSQGKPVGPGIPLPKAERSILTVLAQRGPCSRRTLALSAGYAVGGGGFCNALSRCRTSGWLEGDGTVRITKSGAEALGPVDPMPTGAALIEHWKSHAGGKAERLIIETLAAGGTLSKAELAERCGYAADGGGFSNALSRLRTLCVVEGSRDISLAVELRGVA